MKYHKTYISDKRFYDELSAIPEETENMILQELNMNTPDKVIAKKLNITPELLQLGIRTMLDIDQFRHLEAEYRMPAPERGRTPVEWNTRKPGDNCKAGVQFPCQTVYGAG